jgi:diaminopimelate epimerase
MRRIAFFKMHGLGNDFVVLDGRWAPIAIDATAARAIADRHTGVGCDQVIVLEPPGSASAHLFARFFNADGSAAEACGNGTRCIAWLIGRETHDDLVSIETVAGVLAARPLDDGQVAVDMGTPRLDWRDIPMARPMDTERVELSLGPLAHPACSNIGNPHATFFVDDAEAIDLAVLGPRLEHDPLFPQRANIGVASVADAARIRLRVWERGAGITRACGSGACAALVAAHRRGLTARRAIVALDGGELDIVWRPGDEGGHVIMTGPAVLAFDGSFDAALLGG